MKEDALLPITNMVQQIEQRMQALELKSKILFLIKSVEKLGTLLTLININTTIGTHESNVKNAVFSFMNGSNGVMASKGN